MGKAGVAGRQEVEEGRVAVPSNTVRGQGALVRTQTLADNPALHPWVETILEEHLRKEWGWGGDYLRSSKRSCCATQKSQKHAGHFEDKPAVSAPQ